MNVNNKGREDDVKTEDAGNIEEDIIGESNIT